MPGALFTGSFGAYRRETERALIIPPALIANHITPNPEAEFEVLHPHGACGLVMRVIRAEALALAASEAIRGVANKRGYIKHFELLISARAAHRIVKRGNTGGIAAEDNYTIVRTPGGTFSHHQARSAAYRRGINADQQVQS